MSDSLAPTLRDRVHQYLGNRGWPRTLALRRLIAAALVLLAAWLALAPRPPSGVPTSPMVVAAHDLAPGVTLSADDLRIVPAPAGVRPAAALGTVDEVAGRVLAGAATSGEPLTRARLVGPENTRLATGEGDAVAVPVRLADPAVANLLTPGVRVDIVGAHADADAVLASAATVITVLADGAGSGPGSSRQGRLVVMAMPRDTATRVAAASLGQEVTVTLR